MHSICRAWRLPESRYLVVPSLDSSINISVNPLCALTWRKFKVKKNPRPLPINASKLNYSTEIDLSDVSLYVKPAGLGVWWNRRGCHVVIIILYTSFKLSVVLRVEKQKVGEMVLKASLLSSVTNQSTVSLSPFPSLVLSVNSLPMWATFENYNGKKEALYSDQRSSSSFHLTWPDCSI